MLAFENCKFYFVIVGFILIKWAEHNETQFKGFMQ